VVVPGLHAEQFRVPRCAEHGIADREVDFDAASNRRHLASLPVAPDPIYLRSAARGPVLPGWQAGCARLGQSERVPRTGNTTVYVRPEGLYVASNDRTTTALWIGSGLVEIVQRDDTEAVGRSILCSLDSSVLEVAHPAQHEWSAQRKRSLDAILKLARVRSWRAFISAATTVGVSREGAQVMVTPDRRDERRADVFSPWPNPL